MQQKLNERVWAGQLISWIHEEIRDGRTVFEDATNDAGIKLESGKTKFPDILLFTDKVSGIIFNGWELKFPDTEADNIEMLLNALEKAERIKSNSFVTWNGTNAIIWKIENNTYSIDSISRLKEYAREKTIISRSDLTDPDKFRQNETILRKRLSEILHDLGQLYKNGELKQAINISGNFIDAVTAAAKIILPQFRNEIIKLKGIDVHFRKEFNQWKIYEHSTLNILASSSRRPENMIEEEVLAKFTFYNLIGKIIFYLTLSENLSGSLQKLDLNSSINVKQTLDFYFGEAGKIDYQAVYKPYFTDKLNFNQIVNETVFELLKIITEFDFKVLPTDAIGTILENLVPKEEKLKFGQYFTPETLANLVAFPAIQTANDFVFDPTSGTGTFLNSFYQILTYHGNNNHAQLLNQIWGNDISHFPAILSVINLYKQKIKNQTDNFPKVIRGDYFNLDPLMKVVFPDSNNFQKQIEQSIPVFNAISGNFPFIRQEDIPNSVLTKFFREKFGSKQKAFLKENTFKINERSDYFTYCIYNSIRFLKNDGFISAITSNAWLGKEYGIQFRKFLLDNFHIRYVMKSASEHWFRDSKVSAIFIVLQMRQNNESTKFVTVNCKLDDYFDQGNINLQLKQIEEFYSDIDNYDYPGKSGWRKDPSFSNLYHKSDGSVTLNAVSKQQLENSLSRHENWESYFISADLLDKFDKCLAAIYPKVIDAFRGERTGWNKMFIIPSSNITGAGLEKKFLTPYVKSPAELDKPGFGGNFKYFIFTCDMPPHELTNNYRGAENWIKKFQNEKNKNGTKTIESACKGHKPYWYSINPKKAHIVTALNPYERFFFCFSETPFMIDQRFIALTVKNNYDVELIAALLNSIITFLTIEMRGTSRNLGALDLNANYFKNLRVLNPDLLSVKAIIEIKKSFRPLKERPIMSIFEEVKQPDRINFDKTVLKAFGIDDKILSGLYQILSSVVRDRITMKAK